MARRTTRPADDRIDRLSSSLGLLHGAFRKLSRSAAIRDLARKFGEVLEEVFPGSTAGIYHYRTADSGWEILVSGKEPLPDSLGKIRPGDLHDLCSAIPDESGLSAVQKLSDGSALGLHIGAGRKGGQTAEEDLFLCSMFLQVFDHVYQELVHRRTEKSLVFSLNHRILQLNSLIETGIEVARLDEKQSPYQLALVRAVSLTNASKGIVTLSSGKRETARFVFPEGAAVDPRSETTSSIEAGFTFGRTKYRFILQNKESRNGIEPFEETDKLLLDALARQVEAALENRYLHQQELEKQSIERDLAVAASIQQKILPVALPSIPGYDCAGINIPSKSVGGDYYDCIPLNNGKFAFVIADVAGKGVSAALLVSALHSYLLAYLENFEGLPVLADRLNRALYRDSTDDKFVTALIVVLDPGTGQLDCLNAGHNPAYLLRMDGTLEEFTSSGLPLGMMDLGIPYQSTSLIMKPGDRLFLYTDGVTEATNAKNEMFEHRHSPDAYLSSHITVNARAFVDGLIADIRKFSGSAPQADDITVLCVQRT